MVFTHTPYDGSKQPFTVGLEPVSEDAWLEPDEHLCAHLARKAELLETVPQVVFRAEPDTLSAQAETLALVVEHLKAHHTKRYDVTMDGMPQPKECDLAGRSGKDPDLMRAASLIQEDLVLMRPGDNGYRIAAACLCFPSSWSLAEKFGQSMHDIHEGVPDFNTGRMGKVVGRIFENLQVGQLVGRYNWSIYDDPDLHHPQAKQLVPQIEGADANLLARLFVRVERQTLRRLAGSGDILFTIKIHHDPLAALERDARGANLAQGLCGQLLALDAEQLAYKGLSEHRDRLAASLMQIAQAQGEESAAASN
ncbi:heme-dependent oxidative N-demethylase family protein [Roseibium sp.]|uniref:heme-dependent oxidative N-demethylase family protein n=1 Tax=Roseibium sp. TaxID=1936156 RepID=UPI003A980217